MFPNFFHKLAIPTKLPADMEKAVAKLKKCKSKKACLEQAYTIITHRVVGKTWPTYTRIYLAFQHDLNTLWQRRGFMHCTHQNYLLRVLLVKSKFSEREVRQQWTRIGLSPHQYVQVKLNKQWVDVDCWAHYPKNLSIGTHAGR